MLRDSARTSKKLARVNAEAERLYWRLVMVADDFGRFDADPIVIRAQCFPRHGNAINDTTVKSALLDLVLAGLILEYEVNGDVLGQFAKWDQRVRAEKSRFPGPECGQLRAVVRGVRSAAAVDEDVVVDEDGDEGVGVDVARAPADLQEHTSPTAPVAPVPEIPVPVFARECPLCLRLLHRLNDLTTRGYSLVEPGGPWLHLAHERFGVQACEGLIDRKCREWLHDRERNGFLTPKVLFKPKNVEQWIFENDGPKVRTLAQILGEKP